MQRESPTGEAHDSSSLSSLTVCALTRWLGAGDHCASILSTRRRLSCRNQGDYTHHRRRSQPHAVKHRYEGINGGGEGEEQESG